MNITIYVKEVESGWEAYSSQTASGHRVSGKGASEAEAIGKLLLYKRLRILVGGEGVETRVERIGPPAKR